MQESALRIFRERGYTASTVEEISAEAGVARATFYLHFKSKSELALSITESVYPPLASRYKELDDILTDMNGNVSAGDLEPWLASLWAAHQENIVVLRMWEEMIATEPSVPYLPTPHRSHVPRYLASRPASRQDAAWAEACLADAYDRPHFYPGPFQPCSANGRLGSAQGAERNLGRRP